MTQTTGAPDMLALVETITAELAEPAAALCGAAVTFAQSKSHPDQRLRIAAGRDLRFAAGAIANVLADYAHRIDYPAFVRSADWRPHLADPDAAALSYALRVEFADLLDAAVAYVRSVNRRPLEAATERWGRKLMRLVEDQRRVAA